jgi:hypothetical protein
MRQSQRTTDGTGSSSREQNSSLLKRPGGPARLQSVKHALPTQSAFPKISTMIFRKKAFAFEKRRISHAVRASTVLRLCGRPSHVGSADARQKFQREFAHDEGSRGASVHLLPSLSAGGRRLVDATALSGDECQGVSPAPLRRKECDRRNATAYAAGLPSQSSKRTALTPLLGDACSTSWPRDRSNGADFEPIRPVPQRSSCPRSSSESRGKRGAASPRRAAGRRCDTPPCKLRIN